MAHQHPTLSHILSCNAQWAKDVEHAQPGFFAESAKGQRPKILWIGCADSRVPESVVTASRPGDIFVHRNIANQFHLEDDSILSVLTFAVEVLGVEHVIIVGHTECGGAAACLGASNANQDVTVAAFPADAPLNRWLAPMLALTRALSLTDVPHTEALVRVVEANVEKQMENLCKAEPITRAWSGRRKVWVHGLVYEVGSGTLRDLGLTRGPTVEDN